MRNLVFIGSCKNHTNFVLWSIWIIFVCIQYFKYSNIWNINFKCHTWMFMFNTKKLHSFIQNYITIIARMELKHKSYIFHIKMSQVKKTYHLYKSNMYIFHTIFTLWSPQMSHGHIVLWFSYVFLLKFCNIVSLWCIIGTI